MASTVTLAVLRDMAKRRADMENSNFVTASGWLDFINSAAQELYDILVSKAEDYYTVSDSIVADGATDTFDLPADFYKILGVDYQLNGRATPMARFTFADRNRYQDSSQVYRYRLVKNTIVFTPTPSAQTFTLWYVPAFTKLALDADTLDGVNGWEEYVVVDAAIRAMIKQEQDPSALMARKQELLKRIEAMAGDRDQGLPKQVTDVRGDFDCWDECL